MFRAVRLDDERLGALWLDAMPGRLEPWPRFLQEAEQARLALVVCLTLVCVVIIAKLVGCSLPILASRLGFDPAVMAGPFITTIVDVLSLLVYFRVAGAILHL